MTLNDPVLRGEYDLEHMDLGRLNATYTPPKSFFDDDENELPWKRQQDMPPSPDSTRPAQRSQTWNIPDFDAKRVFEESISRPRFLSFLEATILFHPEDRRHIWLCDPDDDPVVTKERSVSRQLHVSLQE